MGIQTIGIPDPLLNLLNKIVNAGEYPSRSEAIRDSIRKFLPVDEAFFQMEGWDAQSQ